MRRWKGIDDHIAANLKPKFGIGNGSLMERLDEGSETGAPRTATGILKRFYRLSGEL